jgi:hypothetical protein
VFLFPSGLFQRGNLNNPDFERIACSIQTDPLPNGAVCHNALMQVYAAGAPLTWHERQRQEEGLDALMATAGAMRPGSSVPDGLYGWMAAYNVTLCPVCRAGVCRRCRDCGRVAV